MSEDKFNTLMKVILLSVVTVICAVLACVFKDLTIMSAVIPVGLFIIILL